MAFIWKDRKSGAWYLDYTPPGGRRTRKRIGRSKQAAQLALKQTEYQLSFDRAGVSAPDATLSDFFAKYMETIVAGLRPKSRQRYRAILDHFRVFVGPNWEKLKLQQLGREHFEQYIAWRRSGHGAFNGHRPDAPAKAKTVNTELDMLASMLNKAVQWRYLSHNPAKSLQRLKEDDRKPFRFFSTEEVEILRIVADLLDGGASRKLIRDTVAEFRAEHSELIANGNSASEESDEGNRIWDRPIVGWLPHGRTILEFLLQTGSREDETLRLQWSAVDLKRGALSYRRREDWRPKGSEREIALRPELIDRLGKLPRSAEQPFVFLDREGKPIAPRTFERAIQRLIKLAEIPRATLHDFRHTFASHLAMAGVPLPTIQQLLGHKDIQTVMIYAHLSPQHLRDSVGALPF